MEHNDGLPYVLTEARVNIIYELRYFIESVDPPPLPCRNMEGGGTASSLLPIHLILGPLHYKQFLQDQLLEAGDFNLSFTCQFKESGHIILSQCVSEQVTRDLSSPSGLSVPGCILGGLPTNKVFR